MTLVSLETLPSSAAKMALQNVSPKFQHLLTSIYSVTTQKNIIVITVRTYDLFCVVNQQENVRMKI
jgi:hypothetical protein